MTKYKENDILIDEDGNKRKILGVCGQIYFVSHENKFECANNAVSTKKDLENIGYKLLEEEFNPKNREVYYFPNVNEDCSSLSMWENNKNDIRRKATVGVYLTKEESNVRLKKILNAISNLD